MTHKDLEHNQSYEWYGTFWFPTDDGAIKYSGKVSYSPDNGIQLSIQEIDPTTEGIKRLFRQDQIARKIMHGSVHGKESLMHLTLFNVVIRVRRGNFHTAQFSGSARALLCDVHCNENDLQGISLCYDNHFGNFFLLSGSEEENAIAYDKGKALSTGSGWEISFRAASTGTTVHKPDDLNSIFWSFNDPDLKELKTAVAPILENNEGGLLRRSYTEFRTSITKKDQGIDAILKQERLWRSFFEMLLIHSVSVLKANAYYNAKSSDNKIHKMASPILCSIFVPKKQNRQAQIIQNLPIDYFSLGSSDRNLSDLKTCIDKWFEMNADGDWSPVIDGINRLMKMNDTFGDTSQYSALKADIETFFDLINGEKGNIDILVDYAASDEWREKVSTELSFPNKSSIGDHMTKIRDSITHPVGTKSVANGFYSEVRKNPFKLQSAYAYLGALYLKAILSHLGVAEDEVREKYCQRFIELHANYEPINFG